MTALRLILAAFFLTIAIYTALVIPVHGLGLFPEFFGQIAAMNWQGQFNVDFSCFLILAALWVMWRHAFSPLGILLGLIASVGGMLFLSAYLLVSSFRTQGGIRALLLGVHAHVA